MRKIFFGIVALVAMVATSCQQTPDLEEVGVVGGNLTTVSFNLGTPQIANRAFSDGATATHLQYAVYDANGNILNNLTVTDAEIHGSTTVEFQLTTGNYYYVLFWASAYEATDATAPYQVNLATKTLTVNYDNAVCNDESRDAFFYYSPAAFKVESGMAPIEASLKRPFAQLNIGTSDFAASASAGHPVTHAKVTTYAYKSLNFATGVVEGKDMVYFGYDAVPGNTEVFPVNDTEYDYIAMNYLLMANTKETIDVVFTYATAYDSTTGVATNEKQRTVGSVPVQRNHRTNLFGQLFTSNAKVNVTIEDEYVDDDKYGAIDGQIYVKVANAEEFNAAFADENIDIIILADDIVLSEVLTRAEASATVGSGKSLTIDLNNFTLSATSSATANYSMFTANGGTLTVKNGNLEIEHKGSNMEWNCMTTIFNITGGGVVNLEGVTAKNLGGTDMAFVAHLNNWGEATLNVDNSTLESTYRTVRVFNSGPQMNNVTIKNSTLKGKVCFWVQFYGETPDQYGGQSAKTLNIDITDGSNTFIYTGNAPIYYGSIYYSESGDRLVLNQEALAAALAEGVKYVILADGNYELSTLSFVANDVTLVGASKEGVILNLAKSIYLQDKSVTLNNLTYTIPAGLNYTEQAYSFVHHATAFNLVNCNANRLRLNVHSAVIDGCQFDLNTNSGFDGYAIYYYGKTGSNVKVLGSKFNTAGKAIVMYNEGATVYNLDVEGCEFVSSNASTDKAAIQMHTEYGISGTLDIVECTATGFAAVNGGLWNEVKNNVNPAVPNDNFVVTVDGSVVKSSALIESEAAVENAVVEIPSGSYVLPATYANGVTFKGEEGTTLTMPETISKSVTIEGATLSSSNGVAFDGNNITLTLNNCSAAQTIQRMSVSTSSKKLIEMFNLATDILDASRNNTLVIDGTKVNANTTVISTADELIAKTSISAGEVIILTADIDLAGKTFNGLTAFHPENNNTFDGMGYTVSNWTNESGASDFGFIKNWVGPIKNVTIANATLKTSGRSAVVAAKVYGDIKNCHVINSTIEDSYWACGIIAGLYNSGSIYDCTVAGSSVKSNGGVGGIVGVMNESAGTRGCYNCSISNSTVHNTGIYGESYSGALVCGLINLSNSIIEFEGCTFENNTKEGSYVGDLYYNDEGNTVVVK